MQTKLIGDLSDSLIVTPTVGEVSSTGASCSTVAMKICTMRFGIEGRKLAIWIPKFVRACRETYLRPPTPLLKN
jgi:hypothetical protein